MKRLKPMVWATALLFSPALSSCTKEEMKQKTNKDTWVNITETKNLSKNENNAVNNNYILRGKFYDDNGLEGCVGSNGYCMVVVRPVTRWINGGSYIMTPDRDAGDEKLQVDKYKASGIETRYYSKMDVTIEQNGDQRVEFIP